MRPGRITSWIAAALFLTLAGGCGNDLAELHEFLNQAQVRQPAKAVAGYEYRVLPPDGLSITSLQVVEINGFGQQIRPDGKINLPLLGELYVAGMTPMEIQNAIIEKAKEYYDYDKIDVTVNVAGYNSQRIYVFGQVGRPGPIPWTGTNTLLDVLATAQPTFLAWPERIRLVRGRPPTKGGYLLPEKGPGWEPLTYTPGEGVAADGAATQPDLVVLPPAPPEDPVDEEAKILMVNMWDMVKRGDLSHNLMLWPDDVIYVPANPFAKVGLALRTILFPVGPVLEAVRVPTEIENAANPQNTNGDNN